MEDDLAVAAAVVCGRFLLVGKRRQGGMGDTPRKSGRRKAANSEHFRRDMLHDYIGSVKKEFGE